MVEIMRDVFNWDWIDKGIIAAGSIPTCPDDIKQLQDNGIIGILSLTRRSLMDCEDIADTMVKKIIDYRHYPLPDGDNVDEFRINQAISFIDFTVHLDRPVFVHCRAGIGRTGTVLIAYFVRQLKMSLTDAYQKVRARKNTVNGRYADDLSTIQHEWLKGLK